MFESTRLGHILLLSGVTLLITHTRSVCLRKASITFSVNLEEWTSVRKNLKQQPLVVKVISALA